MNRAIFIKRRKKEEGRGKKEEGRGKKEEGRRKKEEGRGKKEEGRGKKEESCSYTGFHKNEVCQILLLSVERTHTAGERLYSQKPQKA
ncbi:MAG: hypothetical protein JGK12_12815 [Microcoleus sp. PH2017_01_SCD_O_A]|uniref:hypothetical protein n=1 Tax=unclassified Microcoleus TaxID=2642155 RepID=UPI001D870FDF|nr:MULTISPECIES: hypothetical protein [unclassified Microcoleus]MCC3424783.1 hypothetical protein [Microcoleus sp. PH2017_01_SCD_O_A]MCC3455554.1 hypothetical protein [Microcoleus sp. PH2017_08_TRC_O_A]MCC3567312.1 hypothetical protein [Microcoleus sp. PH2017_31_RDM_U_A]MCC3579645.1 hypothetical protein [Microcoleus sp. PH2017_32_RDM_D_A]MCC3617735.1 hypothetical protein [Microcoleus sp. PH2017_38_RDM_U_B]